MANIGTLPSTVKPTNIEISSMHQTYVNVSQNLTLYRSDRGGHRWKLTLTYPPMTRDQYSEMWAFLVKARGRFNTFDYKLENHAVQGTADHNITVNENVVAGTRTLAVTNLQSGTNAKAGDFVKINNSQKVYMLTADLVDDGSGDGTLEFEPSLQTPVSTATPVTFASSNYNDCITFEVTLMDEELVTEFGTAKIYGLTISLMETFG